MLARWNKNPWLEWLETWFSFDSLLKPIDFGFRKSRARSTGSSFRTFGTPSYLRNGCNYKFKSCVQMRYGLLLLVDQNYAGIIVCEKFTGTYIMHIKWKSAQRDANTARPPQSPHRRTESAMAVVRQVILEPKFPPRRRPPSLGRRTAKI